MQGTLVVPTALVAAISASPSSSFLLAGRFTITPVTVLVGLVWAVLIFFFDRVLASGSFNPYHFSRGQVASLRDAPARLGLAARDRRRRERPAIRSSRASAKSYAC